MGIPYFVTCRPVNLSTRVDILEVKEMVIHCVWLLAVSKTAHCSHFILVSLRAS